MNEYACRAGGGRGCVARTLRSVASLVLACSYADPQVYVRTAALSRARAAQAGKNAVHCPPLDYCPAQRKKKQPRPNFPGRGCRSFRRWSADHSAAKPRPSSTNSLTPGSPSRFASR